MWFILPIALFAPTASDDCPFTYPPEEAVSIAVTTPCLSPCSPSRRRLRLPLTLAKPPGVHRATQTDVPHLTPEPSRPAQAPALLAPSSAPLSPCPGPLSPCPSPVPVRKKAYAKWENRVSTILPSEEERSENKPSYEHLERVT